MINEEQKLEDGFRAGFVGVVGLPNAGKSTLVNALIREKVSIVTAKAQTTRQRIQGILTEKTAQYIFTDAPGIIHAESGLNKFLQDEAEEVREQSDVLMALLNIDCKSEKRMDEVIEWVVAAKKPWVAVITKTDLPELHRGALIERKLSGLGIPIISLSAKRMKDYKRADLLEMLRSLLPESPSLLFDKDLYTTQSVRQMAAEIIREKCFKYLQKEIPYGLAVRISSFKEEDIPKIYADILISKDGHRSILIGVGGSRLREIGTAARREIETMMGEKVFLDLHVTIKKKWMKNNMTMKDLGYVSSN